jgi:hypothetical protein
MPSREVRAGRKRDEADRGWAADSVRRRSSAMRTFRSFLTLAFVVLAVAPAAAQINPFRSGRTEAGLSGEDVDLLLSSVNALNRSKDVAVGSSESWRNPATGSRGTSSVIQILNRAGMTCHRVRHEVAARGSTVPRRYDLTWCLTPGGEWKMAE